MAQSDGRPRRSEQLARLFDDPGAEDGVPCLDLSLVHLPAVFSVRLDRDHQRAPVCVGARVDDDLQLPEMCLDHVQADPVPAGKVGRSRKSAIGSAGLRQSESLLFVK